MNNAWIGLEKAPQGSMKNKIHGYFPKFFFFLSFFFFWLVVFVIGVVVAVDWD